MTTTPLIDDTDARRWAREFTDHFTVFTVDGTRPVDDEEGLMISWFANAIETGRRHHPAQVAADRRAVEAALRASGRSAQRTSP